MIAFLGGKFFSIITHGYVCVLVIDERGEREGN